MRGAVPTLQGPSSGVSRKPSRPLPLPGTGGDVSGTPLGCGPLRDTPSLRLPDASPEPQRAAPGPPGQPHSSPLGRLRSTDDTCRCSRRCRARVRPVFESHHFHSRTRFLVCQSWHCTQRQAVPQCQEAAYERTHAGPLLTGMTAALTAAEQRGGRGGWAASPGGIGVTPSALSALEGKRCHPMRLQPPEG